jgi:FkbM family methyltransferase
MGLEGWHVEAIPALFQEVAERCASYPSQHAIHACLSNTDGAVIEFNVASNNGLSSSILELGRHAMEYPGITYTEKLMLQTKTIDGLIRDAILPKDIDFLLLDTQGAEGLILDGAELLLTNECLIACQIETAVVPLYKNGATYFNIANKLVGFNLHLKSIDFNSKGWTDALFCKPY